MALSKADRNTIRVMIAEALRPAEADAAVPDKPERRQALALADELYSRATIAAERDSE